jgi:hypothetical protein
MRLFEKTYFFSKVVVIVCGHTMGGGYVGNGVLKYRSVGEGKLAENC